MSKVQYFNKYLNFEAVKNLLNFNTQYPELLTREQYITRFYRGILRCVDRHFFYQYAQNYDDYHMKRLEVLRDFKKLDTLEEGCLQWNEITNKWFQFQEDYFDPQMYIHDSREGAPTAGRYEIYTDQELAYDPFGFYSKNRPLSEKFPDEHKPQFVPEFPESDMAYNIFTNYEDEIESSGE